MSGSTNRGPRSTCSSPLRAETADAYYVELPAGDIVDVRGQRKGLGVNTPADHGEFLSVINNEYFVLQGASASSISEASSRASLYLLTLSSGLVSLGFVIGLAPVVFTLFAAGALTTIFVLGWFTVFRLIDTSVANVRALRGMARIRIFYAGMQPRGMEFFDTAGDAASDAWRMLGIPRASRSVYSTMASMIGAVNGVVGGVGVAMTVSAVAAEWVAVAAAICTAILLFATVAVVQRRRFAAEFPPSAETVAAPD